MRFTLINLTTAIAFTFCITSTSFAQDFRFGNNDPLSNKNSPHAGLYLKIPFSGGLRNYKKDKIKFGATLGFRRNYETNYRSSFNGFSQRRHITLNVLDLKFNENGYKTVSLVGQDLSNLKIGDTVYIEDEKGGTSAGKVVLYTLAVLGGVVLIAVIQLAVDKCARNWFDPECS